MGTPFHDIRDYLAIPRVTALRLSPDGDRLAAVVQTPSADGTTFGTALWQLDPHGEAAPHRLTRSAEGETRPAFRPDGSLLFTSKRPDPADGGDAAQSALWALPPHAGEAGWLVDRPGGVGAFVVAENAGTVVFAADTMAGAADDDGELRAARKDAGVSAILHESYPIRHWDHDLGPAQPRLYVLDEQGPRGLTPQPGRALDEQSFAVSPDGRTVVTGWAVAEPRGERWVKLVAIDTASGDRRILAAGAGHDFHSPRVSPDGRWVVCVWDRHASYDEPRGCDLWVVPLDGPPRGRGLLPVPEAAPGSVHVPGDTTVWPRHFAWSSDSSAVYVAADERGRRPVFRIEVATAETTPLTRDDAAYSCLEPSPDGRYVYALRAAIDGQPQPVRIDATTGEITFLPSPGSPLTLPGRVEEITATADDGVEIRGWLVLPKASAPAPLLLWPHGGPHLSWNDWNWRWSHWVMAAQGYAVLLPDPALSTGYGPDHIRRGHGRWGPRTHADLMAILDTAVARDDIDETRTALMGGSFGGYMANWMAGHTDRFKAIISHAGLWNLELKVSADLGSYFIREFGDPAELPERWELNSPHQYAADIRTPMLVIHGDKDYRVPVGNALWQWFELVRGEVDAKFLYFPDENHWILTPGNAAVWYETVLAFLAHHVLGEEWKRPELL
ncbi:MAG: prolyl oligopeptidase family serine peptidase [Actinomadura sp.]